MVLHFFQYAPSLVSIFSGPMTGSSKERTLGCLVGRPVLWVTSCAASLQAPQSKDPDDMRTDLRVKHSKQGGTKRLEIDGKDGGQVVLFPY